jgi:hypothetical protein
VKKHRYINVALVAVLLSLSACASGTVTTSTGVVVPASVVQSQDLAADVLKMLDDAYIKAVAIHDSQVATDNPSTHAARRKLLLQTHDGLVVSWTALITWKKSSTGTAVPAAVLTSLGPSLPAFVDLAVGFGLLTQAQADMVLSFAAPILGGFQ